MSEHFNKLTPAEHERLALLMEECAEVIAICGKIMRHGYDSHDPTRFESQSNRAELIKELGDVEAAKELMIDAGDLVDGIYALTPRDSADAIERRKDYKLKAVKQWMHHQVKL